MSFKSIENLDPGTTLVPLIRLAHFTDDRGSLSALSFSDLPFELRRFFFVFDSGARVVRGEHAHRECWQVLVALVGWTNVAVESPVGEKLIIRLDSARLGLVIPPMYWASQFERSHGSLLGVFASHAYDETDYIRDYNNWLQECRRDI